MGRSTDVGGSALPDDAQQPIGPDRRIPDSEEITMLLATTTVEDVDRFLEVFGNKGADKRAEHGSKGATVFRDPAQDNRVWALFDWDEAGWAAFVSDPTVPPVLKDAGHLQKPEAAAYLATFDA
jgi:hypothetical protein